jgi:hypothetical protein
MKARRPRSLASSSGALGVAGQLMLGAEIALEGHDLSSSPAVAPANAGAQLLLVSAKVSWVPAFAGTTDEVTPA